MAKKALSGNALIGQSGGPTSVINASLAGVIEAAMQKKQIKKLYGMRYGIEGFMKSQVVDLSKQKAATIKGLHSTPSSALGSCRHKVKDKDFPVILKMLKRYNIRYFFLIGGNDTMDTIHRVEKYCADNGYDLIGVGIPKTVDNDLYGTDHTPGYGSAARYVALSVLQSGLLARDMTKVDQFVVHQTVGREAGWLAAASALAKTTPDSAPHIILIPEKPFIRKNFIAEAKRIYKKCGFVYVVVGEGVLDQNGNPVSSSKTKDKFANVEFGAMGGASVAMQIHSILSKEFGWRGEFQVTESMPMCGADRASRTDVKEAAACGRKAVQLAASGKSGVMVSMVRKKGKKYQISYETAPLSEVAVRAKEMPAKMISKNGMYVTKAFLDYAAPLVGELPEYVSLDFTKK
ncbi:MAG: diphosphate--fructose-6-phosphate 1-phosphotransferase [Planctomycetota bacterium]|jgi:6-phosphofructokinase 1